MKTYLAQAANSSIENRHIAISMDKTKLELADSEKELKWLRAAVDVTKKEYERSQTRNLDLKTVLERERLFICPFGWIHDTSVLFNTTYY